MKKLIMIPLLMLTFLSMAACSNPDAEPLNPGQPEQPENPGDGDDSDDNPDTPTPGGNGRYLVLFASRSGNTERMAVWRHRCRHSFTPMPRNLPGNGLRCLPRAVVAEYQLRSTKPAIFVLPQL